jgi:2-polyprenyl-3-methyl-5-hydroxy-6-metoxy-1,4-benzoquinol methylase
LGFYDNIAKKKKGIRSFWHNQKFKRVIDSFEEPHNSILDIGCFSGTFLSMISPEYVSEQIGVDILKEQIDFANQNYATSYRKFYLIEDIKEIEFVSDNYFDYISIIEVVEHLKNNEIEDLIIIAYKKLKPGGKLIITTPNYASLWPLQEFILNKISDVKYEEQHITHFNYFNINKKLNSIVKNLNSLFSFDYKTTTHFLTPYIAIFSYKFAEKISAAIPHRKWTFPLGSLLLIELTKNK